MSDDAIFDYAVSAVLQHEGGYQHDRSDPGNWTGGKVGAGELRGTQYGISAASYPTIDILNLTPEQASEIYRRDFWLKFRINELPGVLVPSKVLDTQVLAGGWGIRLAQRALDALGCDLEEDGSIGPATVKACSTVAITDFLTMYENLLAHHYDDIVASHPNLQRFLRGWERRALWTPTPEDASSGH